MLDRLPARLQIFVRQMVYGAVGFLAAAGAASLYRSGVHGPQLVVIIAWTLGSVLGALMREVPSETDERQRTSSRG